MTRLYVDVSHAGWARLAECSPGERAFIERWLQVLAENVHPHFALRPLSLGVLSRLHPRDAATDRARGLARAVEDELARRVTEGSADVRGVKSHAHKSRDASCASCVRALDAAAGTTETRAAGLAREMLERIEADDVEAVVALVPALACEAMTLRKTQRYLARTCGGFVLAPGSKRPDRVRDRMTEFLRHDVGGEPRKAADPESMTRVWREVTLRAPAPAVPLPPGLRAAGGRLWIEAGDEIPDWLSRREESATLLRARSHGWLSAIRLLLPDHGAVLGSVQSAFALPAEAKGRPIESVPLRRVLSLGETGVELAALEWLAREDDARASLGWLSLAYETWPSSPMHAAAMIATAIEAIGADPTRAAEAYASRLVHSIAQDLEASLGTGTPFPRRNDFADDVAWIRRVHEAAKRAPISEALRRAIAETVAICDAPDHGSLVESVRIELEIGRSLGLAVHDGRDAVVVEPLARRLATIGAESLRALYALRLEGTDFAGVLEGIFPGRPTRLAQSTSVNGHTHVVEIPTTPRRGRATFESSASGGHRHKVDLSADQLGALAKGTQVEVFSSESEAHRHRFQIGDPPKAASRTASRTSRG